MLLFAAMLLAAAPVLIDPALCKQISRGNTGSAGWETDGRGNLSISFDAPATGEVSLRCRVKLPAGIAAATLRFDHVLVSFQPSETRSAGAGLYLEAGDCRAEVARVAGEDWIEASGRAWSTAVEPSRRTLEVLITVRDPSSRDAVRVDLAGLRLTAGPATDGVCPAMPPSHR